MPINDPALEASISSLLDQHSPIEIQQFIKQVEQTKLQQQDSSAPRIPNLPPQLWTHLSTWLKDQNASPDWVPVYVEAHKALVIDNDSAAFIHALMRLFKRLRKALPQYDA